MLMAPYTQALLFPNTPCPPFSFSPPNKVNMSGKEQTHETVIQLLEFAHISKLKSLKDDTRANYQSKSQQAFICIHSLITNYFNKSI